MRVQGLESGADDYIVKPFLFPELRAVAPSSAGRAALSTPPRRGRPVIGTRTREVRVGNEPADFSGARGRVARVADAAVGPCSFQAHHRGSAIRLGRYAGSNAVEVYIHRIRRKLDGVAATSQAKDRSRNRPHIAELGENSLPDNRCSGSYSCPRSFSCCSWRSSCRCCSAIS